MPRRSNGSSPLARGTHLEGSMRNSAVRFIPARAGNTSSTSCIRASSPVHPRSRGEHLAARFFARCLRGSSPLARGTHHRPRARRGARRFIPARAGNTCTRATAWYPLSVHPRSRGEHHEAPPLTPPPPGSSPLARGTPRRARGAEMAIRFIPARAGNTLPSAARPLGFSVHPRSRGEHVFPVCRIA